MSEIMTVSEFRKYLKSGVDRKRTPTSRPRKSALKKTDAAFSILMRAKEADASGMVKCCTCGKRMPWKGTGEAHWGHWQSRGFNGTRFNPVNGGIQCRLCNTYLEGQKQLMEKYLIQRYGETEVRKIEALSRLLTKVSNLELEQMAAEFSKEAKEIIKQKNLK